LVKAADICAADPARAAQRLVDGQYTTNYDHALQVVSEIPFAAWRDYDVEDTMRFYALRLREVGMIKADPNELVAAGADWRFFNELKRELKT
jgi:NitT/TauT family transport system substrate-binding protein